MADARIGIEISADDRASPKLNRLAKQLLGLNTRSILGAFGVAGLTIQMIRFTKASISAEIESAKLVKTFDALTEKQKVLLSQSLVWEGTMKTSKSLMSRVASETLLSVDAILAFGHALKTPIGELGSFNKEMKKYYEQLQLVKEIDVQDWMDEQALEKRKTMFKDMVEKWKLDMGTMKKQKTGLDVLDLEIDKVKAKTEVEKIDIDLQQQLLEVTSERDEKIQDIVKSYSIENVLTEFGLILKKEAIELADKEIVIRTELSKALRDQAAAQELLNEKEKRHDLLEEVYGGGHSPGMIAEVEQQARIDVDMARRRAEGSPQEVGRNQVAYQQHLNQLNVNKIVVT